MSIYFSKKRLVSSGIISGMIFIALNSQVWGWDGYDRESSSSVEIGAGNLVREGNRIQIYDWQDGNYHDAEVKLVEYNFNSTRLEIYDLKTKKTRILWMDKE
jgi:hypothetical protein